MTDHLDWQAAYRHKRAGGTPKLNYQGDAAGASYYTMDGLGSTILLTDSAQAAAATYSYDSWDNTTSSGAQAAVNPWQYAGGYKDTSTGLTKFGARYYNPDFVNLT